MPTPSSPPIWWGSLIWLLAVAAVAFAVAWLSGTRLHIRKGPYVPLLLAVTVGLSAGYIAWLGVGFKEVVGARWGWGLFGALVTIALVGIPASRQPVDRPVHGHARAAALAWEGAAYGTAEGVLLSALPPFMAWQMVHSLGWSGVLGGVAQWVLPLAAGAAVIVIHHLGYWSCRNRILLPITAGLTMLSAAFLITGSWIAPALAHILLHDLLIIHGTEMPPHDRPAPAVGARARSLQTAA